MDSLALDPVDYQWYVETYQRVNTPSPLHQAITTAQTLIQKVQKAASTIFEKIQEKVIQTPLKPILINIIAIGTDLERGLNLASSTPVLCLLSGPLRILIGKAQVIAGSLIAAIGETGLFMNAKPEANMESIYKWHTISKLGIEHIIHGCLNILRGTGETYLATYTMGLGNIILLIPNLGHGRNFDPFFGYGTLLFPPHPASPAVVPNRLENLQKVKKVI